MKGQAAGFGCPGAVWLGNDRYGEAGLWVPDVLSNLHAVNLCLPSPVGSGR